MMVAVDDGFCCVVILVILVVLVVMVVVPCTSACADHHCLEGC